MKRLKVQLWRRSLSTSAELYKINLHSSKLLDLKNKKCSSRPQTISPSNNDLMSPARTRFAPSPTGFMHMGGIRTALYNYLLARKTGGQFLLRLEDTDQTRLVEEAKDDIFNSLKWAGLQWDEGPIIGGPVGPYVQSERTVIYKKHVQTLIDKGYAYRCFCSKERLDGLRDSARKLYPPSMASYDRKCMHLSLEQSDSMAYEGQLHTIRFKSPLEYPVFEDLLHGKLNLQTQVNYQDLRYEDPVLIKSDDLPTYHLANVVDDHLMGITDVIRGEEWLLSSPKHIALYNAFGWTPPKFVHIPLLTTFEDKKLSKRSGDAGVSSMAHNGILPEALINFVALLGWSPANNAEIFTLKELEQTFDLNQLTKGNAKVDRQKLQHFNLYFFRKRLDNPRQCNELVQVCQDLIQPFIKNQESDIGDNKTDIAYTTQIFDLVKHRLTSVNEYPAMTTYFYLYPNLQGIAGKQFVSRVGKDTIRQVLTDASQLIDNHELSTLSSALISRSSTSSVKRSHVLGSIRYALTGSIPGVGINDVLTVLGKDVTRTRIQYALDTL